MKQDAGHCNGTARLGFASQWQSVVQPCGGIEPTGKASELTRWQRKGIAQKRKAMDQNITAQQRRGNALLPKALEQRGTAQRRNGFDEHGIGTAQTCVAEEWQREALLRYGNEQRCEQRQRIAEFCLGNEQVRSATEV